jgi:hypothetical protein
METCLSEVCRALRKKNKKKDLEAKAHAEARNFVLFNACNQCHLRNGTHPLTCPCNFAAMEDIEVEPVTKCKWEGWSICSNPPCNALLEPLKLCRKRQCSTWRKNNPLPKRKPQPRKRTKRSVASSAQQFSDSSEDDDSDTEITPRKRLPRKSFARSLPRKAALLDGSATSSSEDGVDMEMDLSPEKSAPLQKDPTVTLPEWYTVEEIIEGPRALDGKYLCSWVGYPASQNTWEPRDNLPDSCFVEGAGQTCSDESGDDRPLYRMLNPVSPPFPPPSHTAPEDIQDKTPPPSPEKAPEEPPPRTTPRRTSRIQPETATRTLFESNREGLRTRTGRRHAAEKNNGKK